MEGIQNYRQAHDIQLLDSEKLYKIEIVEAKSKRSILSNRYLWELLGKLEKATKETALDWYVKSLVDTGAKFEYLWASEKAEDTVKQQFRAVQRVKFVEMNNVKGWWLRCIVGTSKYNAKQMNEVSEIRVVFQKVNFRQSTQKFKIILRRKGKEQKL